MRVGEKEGKCPDSVTNSVRKRATGRNPTCPMHKYLGTGLVSGQKRIREGKMGAFKKEDAVSIDWSLEKKKIDTGGGGWRGEST